jgi:RNA polymerase sigma-70 factor, ECF subfamily
VTPLLAQRPRADRAFERLYQKHVHAVYRYALAVLHNEADAEDVTQTTFMSAYRAFQRGERPERPHNWLIKIAHNVCRQRFRDSSRRPQEVAFDESLAAAAPDDSDVPSAGEIRRALGFLGFNQRAALVMRELEGRSYAEIAQILDVSVGAVETLIFRARRALREQLEGGLTCKEAELTLSRLQENKLSSDERGSLRAHLRECKECAVLERRQRAQRATLKNLGVIPLPASLGGSFFGGSAVGGGAAAGGMGIGAKVAAVVAAGLVATGVGHEALKAVAAKDTAPSATHAPLVLGSRFSAVASLTGNNAEAGPIAAKVGADDTRGAGGPTGRRTHWRAQPGDEEASSSESASGGGGHIGNTLHNTVPLVPPVRPPALPVRVPETPQLPPVQLPQVPPLPPLPPVQLPPPPPLPVPPELP